MKKSDKKTSTKADRLVRAAKRALADRGDPKKAVAMQAYMKSEMPYHGVPTPELRETCRLLFAKYPLASEEEWTDAVAGLWREATHREERYAAIELAAAAKHEPFRTLEALGLYEEMIVTGAWWDYVDPIAANLVGELLRRYPDDVGRTMRAWAKSDDNWKRRTSILCQLKFKHHTNTALLYHNIGQSMEVPNFFLRRAIGWALREYAKTEPSEVRRFVTAHAKELHPMSRREAMKHIETIGIPTPRRGRAARG